VLEQLTSSTYKVSENSNRMGYRLAGPTIARTRDDDMISDATPIGALQVPGAGHPILLMADRQTTGGYPQVAMVISADIPMAGQLGPGDHLQFALCSRSEAVAALIAQERAFLAVEHGTW
jgi:antagonist of KipI